MLKDLPLLVALGLFSAAAVAVWMAGGRLARDISDLAERMGMSQGFAGMLILGGITSLPEIATAGSAALTGSPHLAITNLLGTGSVNILLLVVADLMIAGTALAALVRSSSVLLQGLLGMVLMTAAAVLALIGDVEMPSTGLGWGTTGLFVACAGAIFLASRYEKHPGWTATGKRGQSERTAGPDESHASTLMLTLRVAGAGAVILVAGFALSQTADGIAADTGIGTGLVGITLLALATSLPELSSIRTALAIKRYDLAVGDVLGTNLFNIAVLFVVDVAYRDGPAMAEPETFSGVAALLAVIMIGLYLAGQMARRAQTFLRLGLSSWAILGAYAGGLTLLWHIRP